MRISTRIISGAMLVVAAVNIAYAVYFVGTERKTALDQLQTTITENDKLLKVVIAGPLYDGNIEQLDTTLDSFFSNPDIVGIELREYNGNIRLIRKRTPGARGELIASRAVIIRKLDELGEIITTYSTARVEQRIRNSRNELLGFSTVLVLGLAVVIYIVARGLTRPIERLTVAAHDMANGHLDRIIDTRGAEELQSLGQSFIRMRDAIRGKMEDLAAQNEAMRLKDQAIASSIDGIAIANPDGVITYVNTAFLRLWGYDQEAEVLGRSATDFWLNREESARVMESVVARGGSMGELVARRRDGSPFIVELSASLVKDSSGNVTHLMGSFVDITARTRAENELRTAHALLQGVINATQDLIFVKDTNFTYLACNKAFVEYLGRPEEQIVGHNDAEWFPDQQVLESFRVWDRKILAEGKQHLIEEWVTYPDGREVPLETLKSPFYSSDGTLLGLIGVSRDITERKRASEALRENEERLQQAVRASQIGIFDHNHQTDTIHWSLQQRQNYGWGPDETVTLAGFINQVYPEDRERIAAAVQRAHDPSGDGLFDVEHRIIRRDGEVRWLTTRSQTYFEGEGAARRAVRTVGGVIDVTERKRVEQALVQEKAFSDMVIDSLPGIFYICDEQGLLLRWNDNEKVVSGYSKEELSRMNVLRLFQLDGERMAAHLREVFETGRASAEASIVTSSGMTIPFYLTGFRMVADDKRYLVGVGIDITERKRLEQQLLHAQKMESIGKLAGGIAHDFNNILAAIVGYGSILQGKMRNDDPSRKYVNHILTSAERAANLTQSLLAFSRKQVINPKDLDLNDSIRKVEKFLTRIIGEDVMLTTALSTEALMIYADVTQIEQVLMNLATNARDAMPKGGRLMIESGRMMLDDEYVRTKGYGTPGPYAVLNVSDTGEGMDEQTQEKIFEPFFTTKELGRGTGLGLAIVYGIVKQNNGYITVYSEVGKGTTFKIYLPLVSSRTGEVWRPEVQQPLRGGTETILFAEDNETVRLLNREVLQEFGYTVIEAADGEQALQKFREHRDRIDLFILDVIMPKKNGREVFEEARRSNPNVKALFTSGYPADLIQKEGVLEKGLHFLSKPSSPQALLRKVREVLDQ